MNAEDLDLLRDALHALEGEPLTAARRSAACWALRDLICREAQRIAGEAVTALDSAANADQVARVRSAMSACPCAIPRECPECRGRELFLVAAGVFGPVSSAGDIASVMSRIEKERA
jgi:hypothetical protein